MPPIVAHATTEVGFACGVEWTCHLSPVVAIHQCMKIGAHVHHICAACGDVHPGSEADTYVPPAN